MGSLVNRDGNGQVWTIGLGTVRTDFTPDDHSAFNKGMAVSLIESGSSIERKTRAGLPTATPLAAQVLTEDRPPRPGVAAAP